MATTAPAARKIAGTEVPIPGSDRVRWIELTVPSTPSPSPEGDSDPFVLVPPRAASGFHVVSSGDSQCNLAWRFHEEQQNVLEVVDLCASKEFPSSGLRLVFQEALCPFSFLCAREGGRRGTPVYLLYVLTVSGVALLCHLRSPFSYISGSIFPQDDIVEFNLQTQVQSAKVTAVTATSGCLVIGRQDGSICCYSFLNELRDDAGIGRLWSLVSRTKAVGPVQDIVTATVNERVLLFVLHLDGSLRIWDIFNHTKLLSYNVRSNDIEGQPSRIWVGDADDDQELIFLAVLHQGTVGKLIDLKISMDKLWILKEVGSMLYEIVQYDCDTEIMHSYVLQEVSVSDQLFQSSENTLDDLVWTADSIFSSKKEQIFGFISSMFLRRLLQPGVNHSSALRETLLEHKRFLSDSYFQSLTTNGLRKEILSTIEQEFTDCKFDCLSLEKVFCTVPLMTCAILISLGVNPLDNISQSEILIEVLRCMDHISHLLGRSAAAIYHESLISSVISPDEIVSQILKILGTGFSPQSPSALITLFGTDAYAERRQTAHKSQRKFSVEMLLSFRKLQSKSTSWSAVFDVIENFMKYLNTNVTIQEYELKRVCNVNTALLVQATSQVARTMFESTFDLYLFLSYLVSIGGQVSLSQNDIARIKLKLFPVIQDILGQWIVLHFVGISPTTPPTIEDFSYQLSSLQLGKADDLSLHRKFGCSYFTLACLLDFQKSADGDVLSPWFPNPTELVNLVRRFSGSIMSENSAGNVDCFLSSTINLAAVLVRHGQYEAAQGLLGILDTHMNYVKASQADKDTDLARSSCLHLNGFCLLVLACDEANIVLKESKVHEAIRCFFRAASGQEAPKALQKFSVETGFQISGECRSFTAWRLRYYEWAMQIFEQHSMSEGACEFALGALEQIDSIVDLDNGSEAEDIPETTTMIKGRLWANVFKYKLDLKNFQEAYCAIISNPDNDIKYVCLRRFIIVLCELGETKVICNGEIPFTGLVEKVEQELFWKAERSDLLSRPNLYKVLYSFEAYRNNWRKAAAHMYREGNAGGTRQLSHALQERLHALSAAINALQLVDPSFAWLDSVCEADDQISPRECRSFTAWRLRYYEWAMQIFEQHSMSEGACEFALGALEQIDSIVDLDNGSEAEDIPETTTMIKGRLWANVICNGEIPFTGLVEKVEQELFWKAERSDLLSRPNLYKVLYSFEAYRNNWRKAAAHMYREGNAGGTRQLSHALQERLHALSAAINALQLVDPSFAWLDSVCEADDQISPTAFGTDSELSRLKFCVDIEILEKEYTLTEALYMLSTVNSRFNFSDNQSIEALTDILINENMYDMVFTIVLKFRKESGMKRELERVFAAIAQQCCPNRVGNSGKNLLLPSSDDDARDGNGNSIAMAHQSQGSCYWETLEIYLEKYKDLHPRLPVIVAETLLYTDPEIELPLWLVQMFKTTKAGNRMISWGMSGTEADPATLFRLYINYGRHTEAANLLVEYLESFASSRPVDVLHRKKMSAAWFPYTAIERLWCQLEEMQNAGHSVDQCDRLKKLLHGSLMSHLQQVVVDSDDVLSSLGEKGMGSQSN
uniref:Uncharacterized protein n=1 Tax=Oryza barthii TaxID=65489 RepID=A0A0D3F0K1_9ORYZ